MDIQNATTPRSVNGCFEGRQTLRECLSAWVDGDWDGAKAVMPDAEKLLASAPADELKQCWSEYLLIGEMLRAGRGSADVKGSEPDFVAGIMGRLEQEAVAGRSVGPDRIKSGVQNPQVQPEPMARGVAANDAVFRWKMLAGGAFLVAVLAVAWQLVAGSAPLSGATELASAGGAVAPAVAQVAMVPPVVAASSGMETQERMIRDPRLQALLAEHRQNGGMTAWQMPAGFLRNATYEPNNR